MSFLRAHWRPVIVVICLLAGVAVMQLIGLVGYHQTIALCPKVTCRITAVVHGWPLVVDRGRPHVLPHGADGGLVWHSSTHRALNREIGAVAGLLLGLGIVAVGGARRPASR